MSKSGGSPAKGRTAAFAVEALRHANLLRSYLARHLRRPHDVDDLAQQVYLRLIRMSISPSDIKEPVAFIYGAARKELATYWMARYREAQQFPSDGQATDGCADVPSERLRDNPEDALDLQQLLLQRLKELPPMQAACIVLFHRDGMTQEEVAERLELKPDTVKKYLTLARAQLRRRSSTEDIKDEADEP